MRFVVAVITSIALLAHTLLGCSWLHSHDGESGGASLETARAVFHDHDHASSHDASSHDEHSDHDSGELPGCHYPDCVFLAAGPQRMADVSSAVMHAAAIMAPSVFVSGDLAGCGTPGVWFVDLDVGPPTRVHLMYCHLLI
jgi:hypothetical protein